MDALRRGPQLAVATLALAVACSAALGACSAALGACSAHDGRRASSGRARSVELSAGVPREHELVLADARALDFFLEVPRSTVLVRVELSCRQVELDLYARRGERIEDPEDADLAVTTESGAGSISIGRFSEPVLAPGRWWFQVAWTHADLPRTADKRLERVPFTIEAQCFGARIDGALAGGRPYASTIDPEDGGFRTFTIDVPAEARALRLDLADAASDLDLFARPGRPLVALEEAQHFAQHFYGRESLVITRESDPPLAPGRWYVEVVDAADPERAAPFRILATFDAKPPQELLALPALPAASGDGPLAQSLLAVVEIATDAGVGSGTILSTDGWVLTNAHVVTAIGGEPAAEVVVSLSLDPRLPPVESFRARVDCVDAERDLALVRIVSGFYGQTLPPDYRFPAIAFGDASALAIGDPLWLVGYPSTGGQGSRVTISATRGIVSGFDAASFGTLLKTDAEINSGNSGGAALDLQGRLIGVPTSMIELGSGHIGYVHPLNVMPEAWRARVGLSLTEAR